MTTIFKTKIQEGYVIKILVELLNNTVRNICLGIFEHGIEMRTMDSQRHILINVEIKDINSFVLIIKRELERFAERSAEQDLLKEILC